MPSFVQKVVLRKRAKRSAIGEARVFFSSPDASDAVKRFVAGAVLVLRYGLRRNSRRSNRRETVQIAARSEDKT
jgi:hypothetical protein